MPIFMNTGGPWGSGGKGGGRGPWGGNGGDDGDRRPPGGGGGGPQRPGGQGPDIDEIVRKGQEQLRVLMGGRGGGGGGRGGPPIGKGGFGLIAVVLFGLWVWVSIYTVRPEQRSVELFLGEFATVGEPGLNFAPWPFVTKEIVEVTRERTELIGAGGARGDEGLMLTGDENVVDIDFEVVWNINDPAEYLFNLREPEATINAVAESAMREVISRSELAPVLNRDRGIIAEEVLSLVQSTLDSYDSGVYVLRINFDKADPPREVIDAFRDVQAAEQERDRFENEADAYANQRLAQARGEAAELLQQAEGYRASVVNEATGEASRFIAVYDEYAKAQEVTRKRLYLETLERVLQGVDKIVIDESVSEGGQGVVPYLPLNELRSNRPAAPSGSQSQSQGGN